MVETNQLRIRYNKLYTAMRNYTWSYDVIILLSKLEVGCYTAIPDIDDVKHQFQMLKQKVSHTFAEDEDMETAFDKFEDTLNNCEEGIYMKLNQVQEVLPV